jgi:hypothetical protein
MLTVIVCALLRRYKEGHLSSNGQCFDIGIATRMALNKFEQSGGTDPYPASSGETSRAGAPRSHLSRTRTRAHSIAPRPTINCDSRYCVR